MLLLTKRFHTALSAVVVQQFYFRTSPEQALKKSKRDRKVTLHLVSLFDLNTNRYISNEIQSFEIEWKPKAFSYPAQQRVFEGSPGCLCIIALALYYSERTFAGKAVLNNKKLSPSAILKADFCPGETVLKNGWQEMTFNDKKKRKKVQK